jgi:hypothetical protein
VKKFSIVIFVDSFLYFSPIFFDFFELFLQPINKNKKKNKVMKEYIVEAMTVLNINSVNGGYKINSSS